jgi:hypothetical protein
MPESKEDFMGSGDLNQPAMACAKSYTYIDDL